MTPLGTALMVFATLTWIRGCRRAHDGSDLAELTLACVLINVAAFDIWLLSVGAREAVLLWSAHAIAAGLVTWVGLGLPEIWRRQRGSNGAFAPVMHSHTGLRRQVLARVSVYALLAGAAAFTAAPGLA